MNRAEELIQHLLSNPDTCESDGVAYDLLTEYQRGSPVDSLRVLLRSSDDRLVGEGAWIASELPEEGKPLLRDLSGLLRHRSKKVRFYAIDCVLLWAGPSNGHELGSAITLLNDTESAVRWRAMFFLAMASREQLEAAHAQLSATNPESPYIEELKWFLGPEGTDVAQVIAGIRGDDARRRWFAVAAAFRMAQDDSEPLRCAASADDPEIAQLARDMLKRTSSS